MTTTTLTNGPDSFGGGNGEDIIYGLEGNDTIRGGNGDDQLFGGAGNDRTGGGNGKDVLTSGQGFDYLWGGNGCDTFEFKHVDRIGKDTIGDFDQGEDQIFVNVADFDFGDVTQLTVGDDVFVTVEHGIKDIQFKVVGVTALTEADFV